MSSSLEGWASPAGNESHVNCTRIGFCCFSPHWWPVMRALGTNISQKFHKCLGLGREVGRRRNARNVSLRKERAPVFRAAHSLPQHKGHIAWVWETTDGVEGRNQAKLLLFLVSHPFLLGTLPLRCTCWAADVSPGWGFSHKPCSQEQLIPP